MKKFLTTLAVLTVIATPAIAQSFDPESGTENVLAFGHSPTTPRHGKIAVGQSGLHSFAMVPGARAVGPEYNFPYPDRPYGDPDHW